MKKRKTIFELIMLDNVPLWIIKVWAEKDEYFTDRNCLEDLLKNIRDRSRLKFCLAIGVTIAVCGLLQFLLIQSFVSVLLIALGALLLLFGGQSLAQEETQHEKYFIESLYDLIDVLSDGNTERHTFLWDRLTTGSRNDFRMVIWKRLETFAKRRLCDHPDEDPNDENPEEKDTYSKVWETLIEFGFDEADILRTEDHFRNARRGLEPDQKTTAAGTSASDGSEPTSAAQLHSDGD